MRDALICEPLRTPVGRYGGAFRDISAASLAATAIRAVIERSGAPNDAVEDVIFGQCYPNGEAPAIGRVAALDAGLPTTVGGVQVDRRCGSSLQAVLYAAMQVQTGCGDLIIAGGVESMSQVEFASSAPRWGVKGEVLRFDDRLMRARVTAGGTNYPVPGGMLETAENLRREYRISRSAQDELALTSHRRAVAAQQSGKFADEIVGVPIETRTGKTIVMQDEHPRADTSLEQLAALRPVFGKIDPEATVTAGNASGQNDAAAACLVTHASHAAILGLHPVARLVSWASAGVPPRTMGIGPVPAVRKALDRAGLRLKDMDLIELNEAFAVQVLACTRELEFDDADFERLNVNGSGISLGHPVGATGVRILATLLHEASRRGAHFVLETMCIGGGQGLAAIFELLS